MPLPSDFKKDIELDEDSDSHNQILVEHADEIFTYENIIKYGEVEGLYSPLETSEDFYVFINNAKQNGENRGWKLHISVDITDVEKAFDLIAPILFREFPSFKVLNMDNFKQSAFHDFTNSAIKKSRDRAQQGAQFTIYLHEPQNKNELDNLEILLNKMQNILIASSIKPGSTPVSDAKMQFDYFSLRNDRDEENAYLSSAQVGKNYNPLNKLNPYASLLSAREDFSPTIHFSAFPQDDPITAMQFTLKAWINNIIGNLPEEEIGDLKEEIMRFKGNDSKKIFSFIKNDDLHIIETLRQLFILLDYFNDKIKHEFKVDPSEFNFQLPAAKNTLKELFDSLEAVRKNNFSNIEKLYPLESDPFRNLSLFFSHECISSSSETLLENYYSKEMFARYITFNLSISIPDFPGPELASEYIEEINENGYLKKLEELAENGSQIAGLFLAGYETSDFFEFDVDDKIKQWFDYLYLPEKIAHFLKIASQGEHEHLASLSKKILTERSLNQPHLAENTSTLFAHTRMPAAEIKSSIQPFNRDGPKFGN